MPLFPSWKELIKNLVNYCDELKCINLKKEEILIEIEEESNSLLDIAGICAQALGSTRYRAFLENRFDIEIDDTKISNSYKSLFKMLPNVVITTNYDRIPDHLSRNRCYTNRQSSEALRALNQEKNFIFKAHGDITDQDSIVFTREEYEKTTHHSHEMRNFLNAVFSSRNLIFIGFSLTDPHFDEILRFQYQATSGLPLNHYALLNCNNTKATILMKKYGINVLQYEPQDNTHPEVELFINMLNIKEGKTHIKHPKDEALEFIKNLENGGYKSINVFVNNEEKKLHVALSQYSETKLELQQEILNIFRKWDGNEFKQIEICLLSANSSSYSNFWSPTITAIGDSEKINCFCKKTIKDKDFWASLIFYKSNDAMDFTVINERTIVDFIDKKGN